MPNSFLWLGLVALSFFVLVPMMVNLSEPIFRVGDRVVGTRVLHHGGARLRPTRQLLSSGLPIDGTEFARIELNVSYGEDQVGMRRNDNESGFASGPDLAANADGEQAVDAAARRRGRGGYDPEADALASAARYALRQRIVIGLAATIVLSAVVAIIFIPAFWYVSGFATVSLAGYLVYLRTQVRIERDIRERRMSRLRGERGSRSAVGGRGDHFDSDHIPFDDEDPEFEHMDEYNVSGR
ncbi:hypothetical protein IEU95_02965 [Hoyosella rhizosphaerae]|uniref:Transmembrane protein n=1 Tax=Hoyosella rhizosphaerae TaxID=1755582 RepID=A0A916XEQ3_9ACTN|nr:gephyrin-like molybdotransferase receptor GlpR [Hoyosella rhizosphaerae]MBN4925775.1 hypothetical protein [Hoyosella rhizosphaerae]GGC68054.1 hypothetical protein GCM10011410_20960 [Hoyosella rhizosphaerae]